MDSRRAEAFSDGVFAVAITLLVFNLLSIGTGSLGHGVLLDAWPRYFAYCVSFLTIGIMWMNHHTMLAHIKRVNRQVLVLNLFLLMGIVAIPFPTALVAEHLTGPRAADGKIAAVVYGLVMIAISIGFSAMWWYVATHPERLGAVRRLRVSWASYLRFSGGLGGYVVGTLVAAFVSAVAALVIYGALGVYYLFEHLPDPAAEAAGADGDNQTNHAIRGS